VTAGATTLELTTPIHMTSAWTIRSVVAWSTDDFQKRGLPSPRLDAELLVAHALGIDRVGLYMDLDRPLAAGELAAIRELVARRRTAEPVAYILGRREFYGRPFGVGRSVLVPRPETETLVELALGLLPQDVPATILDVGIGSGCIALSVLAERPHVTAVGVDVSSAALEVAAENAARLGLSDRIELRRGDVYDGLPADVRFDLIVSNPPYVTEAEYPELARDIRDHEPRMALVAGRDGLDVIRRLAEGAAARAPRLLIEIGKGQADAVEELLLRHFARVERHPDLGGIERVMSAASA
jgi:release factor glutamine methyltransferase